MSYDNPNRIPYLFDTVDFGGGSDVEIVIRGPKGKKGRIWDVGVLDATEGFNGSTTPPMINVGTDSDADAFVKEFDLQGLAQGDAKTVRSTWDEASDKEDFDEVMVDPDIPADTKIVLTCVAASGSPTGQGRPFIVVDWAD